MSDKEIKLTSKNNSTINGKPFPPTPKPRVLIEKFASVKLNNLNERENPSSNKNNG